MKKNKIMIDPRNARKHGERNKETIRASLEKCGAGRSIVVDNENVIIAGNGVYEQARELGIKPRIIETDGRELVVIKRTDMTNDDNRRKLLALADNRTAELAEWNESELESIIKELAGLEKISLDNIGFNDADIASICPDMASNIDECVDAEPQIDRAEKLNGKWKVKAGDLWLIGDHRLLCGNSTKPEDVARCLDGVVPVLMVTNPPYGVNYDATWRADAGVNKNKGKMGKVANDDVADWSPAWRLFGGDAAYVYHAGVMSATVQASLEVCGFRIRAQIIWAKDRMALSRGDYHWQHEPCWYAVRDGRPGHRTEDRRQTTLWNIPARDDSGHGHSTQKPVECMARPICNHDAPEVYDPFIGSGTTMVAAQNLNRKCYGIEISPNYCAVILERMATAFPKIKICRDVQKA